MSFYDQMKVISRRLGIPDRPAPRKVVLETLYFDTDTSCEAKFMYCETLYKQVREFTDSDRVRITIEEIPNA